MSKFVAAVVQMNSGTDVMKNVVSMETLVRDAKQQGANYVQTPEMTGLVQQDRDAFFQAVRDEESDLVVQAGSVLSKELGITLHIGSTPILVGEKMAANRAFVFDMDGQCRARYDKIHMFDVDLDNGESWRESAVYRPGKKGVILDVDGAKTGLAICYDCRFPELHTAYAREGVEVLTGPSCFTRQTGQAHWHTLLRSRAIETGAFMVAAAQGGDLEDGRSTYGHSLIVNPWGEVIAEVTGEAAGVALAEINTEQVAAARAKIPNLVNNRPFTIEKVSKVVEHAA